MGSLAQRGSPPLAAAHSVGSGRGSGDVAPESAAVFVPKESLRLRKRDAWLAGDAGWPGSVGHVHCGPSGEAPTGPPPAPRGQPVLGLAVVPARGLGRMLLVVSLGPVSLCEESYLNPLSPAHPLWGPRGTFGDLSVNFTSLRQWDIFIPG